MKKEFTLVIVISLLTWLLILLQWFKDFGYIDSVDSWFMLNPAKQLSDVFYAWNDKRLSLIHI